MALASGVRQSTPTTSRAGLAHQRQQVRRADPEVDAGHAERPGPLEHPRGVRHHVRLVVGGRQRAGPRVEQLDGARTRGDLHLEVRGGDRADLAHQRVPDVGGAEHHRLGLRVLLRRPALDEVRRHRERRAREADQRRRPELAHEATDGLGDERHVLGGKVRDGLDVGQRPDRTGHDRADARLDVEVDADRLERQHDVGEEDRRVDAVAPHRLHGDLDDELGVHARLEHPDALAHLEVLGQRAARLAHEPDRRVRHRLAARRLEEGTVTKVGSGVHNRKPRRSVGVFAHRTSPSTYCEPMVVRQETHPGTGAGASPPEFREAVNSMRGARLRPEVLCEEMPAPQRIAPYAFALSADVTVDDTDVGTGRIILLHDPAGNDAWDGTFRCVAYARAEIDLELITDPMLAGVGWTWLTEALDAHGATYGAASGTVTRVATESFGGMADEGGTAQLEIRASWTPSAPANATPGAPLDLAPHVEAWGELLCTAVGLPPVPEGVAVMPSRRGQRGSGR